jgi:2,3-bisphosphoglycerate-dependent phosphoglycerate mutase
MKEADMRSKIVIVIIALITLIFSVPPSRAQEKEGTTIILVRHAEENRLLDSIPLTDQGSIRAKELAMVLKEVKIDAIYSTDTLRTRSTASPVAEAKGLPINFYEYKKYTDLQPFVDNLLKKYKGKTVLIVGHSDDVPAMDNMLRKDAGDVGNVYVLPKLVYDNLFIVFVPVNGKTTVLNLKYGEPSVPK